MLNVEHFKTEEEYKEIMAENSSNLAINISLHIQETEQIPNRINPQKSRRHMIIQLHITKNKTKLKAVLEMIYTYRETVT